MGLFMKLNERELPYLDRALLDTIFASVYDLQNISDEEVHDFVVMLRAMQYYNYKYRLGELVKLFPIFEQTVGPMEINSDGTSLWIAMGLALKELYGMRNETLRQLLRSLTIRK
jgi:hypothetical protein